MANIFVFEYTGDVHKGDIPFKLKFQVLKKKNKLEELEKLNDFKDVSGIWCLAGINKKNEREWLQVGQTQNLKNEIVSDMYSLINKPLSIKIDYINQFGKKVDVYDLIRYPLISEQIYYNIGKNYDNVVFYVFKFNKENLKTSEKFFAYKTKAEYWRNGGSYKSEKEVNIKDLLDSIKPDENTIAKYIAMEKHKLNL